MCIVELFRSGIRIRRVLTSVVLVSLLIPSLALGETVNLEDLILRGDIYSKKLAGIPFTGDVTGKRKGKLEDGKKEGRWITYHDNGQIASEGVYEDGKQEGPWTYYNRDGTVSSEQSGTFEDGEIVQ